MNIRDYFYLDCVIMVVVGLMINGSIQDFCKIDSECIKTQIYFPIMIMTAVKAIIFLMVDW